MRLEASDGEERSRRPEIELLVRKSWMALIKNQNENWDENCHLKKKKDEESKPLSFPPSHIEYQISNINQTMQNCHRKWFDQLPSLPYQQLVENLLSCHLKLESISSATGHFVLFQGCHLQVTFPSCLWISQLPTNNSLSHGIWATTPSWLT